MEFRGAASNPHEQCAPSRVPNVSLRLKEHICPVFHLTVHLEVRRHCLSFLNLALLRQRRAWAKGSERRRDHRWSECTRVDGGAVGRHGLWRSFRKRPVGTVQPPLESGLDATSTRKHCQCLTVETGAQRVGRRWGGRRRAPGHCPQCCAESSLRKGGADAEPLVTAHSALLSPPSGGLGGAQDPRPRFVCGVW